MGTYVLHEHVFAVNPGRKDGTVLDMGVVGAAVVGFVAGIACAILIDEVFSLDGGMWDLLAILIGIGGAAVAVRLVHLRSHPRGPRHHRHA